MRAVVVALALTASAGAWAQAPVAYSPPRLADGHPDFQGIWRNPPLATPLESNPAFGGTLVVRQEEAQQMADAALAANRERLFFQGLDLPDHMELAVVRGEHRTRLIVEPANGKIPYLLAAEKAAGDWLVQYNRAKQGATADGPDQLALSDRCISVQERTPMGPNSPRQIVQSAGYVVISSETNHQTRIVRMEGVHRPDTIRTRMGDPAGHWDGDVLIVETSGFRLDEPFFVSIGPGQSPPFMIGPDSKVIERFTRVSAEELDYTFTIEDPTIYASPWLGEYAMTRSDQGMEEWACHENNYAVALILGGARRAEALAGLAKTAPAAKPGIMASKAQH